MSAAAAVGRLERFLPWACVAAAVVLAASELMTMFEFIPPGAEPLQSQTAGERHGNAMFVIAGFAIAATFVAVWAGSRPAAIGVVTMGVIALLVFLVADLPDAGAIGALDNPEQSFVDAEAVPRAGFWFEMLGAVALAITGAALATMTPEQLKALGGPRTRKPKKAKAAKPKSDGKAKAATKPAQKATGAAAKTKKPADSGKKPAPKD